LIKAKPPGPPKGLGKIFYGWWIVAVAAAIQSIKNGTFGRGFTLFVLPLRNELALGVTAITVAEMLGRMEGGLIGPGAGFLTDRLGPRIMLAAGGIISGVGFILLYFTHSYVYFLLVFVGLISLGFRGGYQNASLPAVNQ
jgi:MFS family permease